MFLDLSQDEFRNLISELNSVGHELEDRNESKLADMVIQCARMITASTIVGNHPPKWLMSDLAAFLDHEGINYAVIGGMALSVHGQLRATEDIDVLVERIPDANITSSAQEMQKYNFYRSKSNTGKHLILDHRKYGMVELLSAEGDSLRQFAIRSAKKENILGSFVPVVTPAVLIATKITALVGSPKRAVKDVPDIISVWLKSKPSQAEMREVERFLTEAEINKLNEIIKSTTEER